MSYGLQLVDDDLGAMDYASLGYDYDDFGDMDYPSLGAAVMPPSVRRFVPRGPSHRQKPWNAAGKAKQVVQKTLLSGSTGQAPDAGANTVTIRPQFDFVAEDVTFQGSVGGWTITAIDFGDRRIFNNATGIPIAVFGTASFVRGLVKGAAIAAGLDITIAANLPASTTTTELIVTLVGLKRGTTGCGPGAV